MLYCDPAEYLVPFLCLLTLLPADSLHCLAGLTRQSGKRQIHCSQAHQLSTTVICQHQTWKELYLTAVPRNSLSRSFLVPREIVPVVNIALTLTRGGGGALLNSQDPMH